VFAELPFVATNVQEAAIKLVKLNGEALVPTFELDFETGRVIAKFSSFVEPENCVDAFSKMAWVLMGAIDCRFEVLVELYTESRPAQRGRIGFK
jgi:hypothetical protein